MRATLAMLLGTVTVASGCDTSGSETASVASSSTDVRQNGTYTTASVIPAPSKSGATPIVITAGDQTITAELNDSAVATDFVSTLPTTLTWNRNYGIEYITELSSPMTETGPFYTDVQPGDIVYYNPMDSITIIYAPTSSVPTLTKMGEITSDFDVFADLPDSVEMRVALA